MTTDASIARKAACDLWESLDFSVGQPFGMRAAPGTLGAAVRVMEAIKPLPDSRISAEGQPLDLFAPTVWHAACLLLATFVAGRLSRSNFGSDPELFETFYGNRSVFRGQARGWNIIPTAWRTGDQKVGLHQRTVFRNLIASYMGPEDAIEFELFGKVTSDNQADALAQHYGVMTNLVDFTFDPRVAIRFACNRTEATTAGWLRGELKDCALVYSISFFLLCHAGKTTLTFPPMQAKRLFLQAGFFVDFGSRPEVIPEVLDYEQPWMWVQQNCARVFFPRTYPEMEELNELPSPTMTLLTPEPFLEEVATRIKSLTDEEVSLSSEAVAASLRSKMQTRPPWRVKEIDGSFFYTDEEFVRIASYVEYYVRIAALLEMNRRPCLDPVIIGKLFELDAAGLFALKQISELPAGRGQQLNWICDRIKDSAAAISKQLNFSEQPDLETK